MTGGLAVGEAAVGGPLAQPSTDPPAAGPPSVVLAVTAVVVVVAAVAAMVRVVPGHQRLVVWRLGGSPLELWSRALTRDGVTVHVKIVAVMSITDPHRYATQAAQAPGAASTTASILVEERVRRSIAERDLVQLAEVVAAGGSPVPDETGDAHLRELERWGLSASLVRIAQADVPLHSLRQWTARIAPVTGGPDRPWPSASP